jgi:hypothetical protein
VWQYGTAVTGHEGMHGDNQPFGSLDDRSMTAHDEDRNHRWVQASVLKGGAVAE